MSGLRAIAKGKKQECKSNSGVFKPSNETLMLMHPIPTSDLTVEPKPPSDPPNDPIEPKPLTDLHEALTQPGGFHARRTQHRGLRAKSCH